MKRLEVKNLSYSYDGTNMVIKGITFSIENGKLMTIVGPNGAGKSTLLKLITGELEIQSGTIEYFSEDGKKMNIKSVNIGYVAQNSGTFSEVPLKAKEVVEMGLYQEAGIGRKVSKELRKKVENIMEELGINDIAEKNIAELSGGQRQKIFIARAVVSSPKILFLDEPLSGVDTHSQKMFYEFLNKLKEIKKLAIVMVTHDLAVVPQISDSTLCVNIKSTFHNEPQEFLESEILKDEFSKGLELYLHDKNIPHRTVKRKEGEK